jgi:hypothetical protein
MTVTKPRRRYGWPPVTSGSYRIGDRVVCTDAALGRFHEMKGIIVDGPKALSPKPTMWSIRWDNPKVANVPSESWMYETSLAQLL